MPCDLPQRFERWCSAEESDARMFDGLQARIIVIVGAHGGCEVDETRAVRWTRGWVFLQRSRRRPIDATTPSAGTQDVS